MHEAGGQTAEPSAPKLGFTPRPDAPPAAIGSSFDDDAALPAAADWVASYTMNARLDEQHKSVHGSGSILWKNSSEVSIDKIWVHLYLNAFKHSGTVFLRSPFGAGRSGEKGSTWGSIHIQNFSSKELGGENLWDNAKPNPEFPGDETDIMLPLPRAISPGESVRFEVQWIAQLPQIVERTGYVGDYFFVAQWFPKLARLEPNGVWQHFPFHAQSEFYADFGRYEVTLDLPEHYVAGATGERAFERREAGRRIEHYVAENVHDFAFTAWPHFQEHEAAIGAVNVRYLFPPGHNRNLADTISAVEFSLPFFNKLYGEYPYRTLTVVHPPRHAANSGGMEYPTLITTGGAWHAGLVHQGVASVTIHELAHQWFYGLVATNEQRWPFLDEGLTSYAELRALQAAYGESSALKLPWANISRAPLTQRMAASVAHDDIIAKPAAGFANFSALGGLVYARTAAIFDTLARVYGEATLDEALGRYARYYRFKHPEPEHLLAVVRETLGDEAARNLELALFQRGSVDYSVRGLASFRGAGKSAYQGRVFVHRSGNLEFPVEVLLQAEDGSEQRQVWNGKGPWVELRYAGQSPLSYVVVDPDKRVGLDTNPLNNAASRPKYEAKYTRERLTYWAQVLLGGLGP